MSNGFEYDLFNTVALESTRELYRCFVIFRSTSPSAFLSKLPLLYEAFQPLF